METIKFRLEPILLSPLREVWLHLVGDLIFLRIGLICIAVASMIEGNKILVVMFDDVRLESENSDTVLVDCAVYCN